MSDPLTYVLRDPHDAADELEKLRERVAEMQYQAGMYQALYEHASKTLNRINEIVHVPTKATSFRSADNHYQADFDAIRKLTAPYTISSPERGSNDLGKSTTD